MGSERTSTEARARSPEVDAFLAAQPEDTRTALEALRRTIAAAAPGADEGIGYRVRTIRFAPDAPLPEALVTKLVGARIAETDAAKGS
jgi:uncharacterized protein YdhG (YjbR/CyaY superfamily)